MSSPPKRHLPDIRYSSLSPTQHGRRDKQHYGSAGDVTSFSRMNGNNGGPNNSSESTALSESTSNAVSNTVPPSPVSIQQSSPVVVDEQQCYSTLIDSNSMPRLDRSQENEISKDSSITDVIDESALDGSEETRMFDTRNSKDTKFKTAEPLGPKLGQRGCCSEEKTSVETSTENIKSSLRPDTCDLININDLNSFDVNTVSDVEKRGLECGEKEPTSNNETSSPMSEYINTSKGVDRKGDKCSQNVTAQSGPNSVTLTLSNIKMRDLQSEAVNISHQHSENDVASQNNFCEEQPAPKLKTIIKQLGLLNEYKSYNSLDLKQDVYRDNDKENMQVDKVKVSKKKKNFEEVDKNDDDFKEEPLQTKIDKNDECKNDGLDPEYTVHNSNGTNTPSDHEYLSEVGAVGGSPEEKLQGILQKTSLDCVHKKTSAVQFNDEVTVETFSQTDPTSSSTTKAVLAHGDGPSPIASLRLSSVTSLNESDFEPAICSSPTSTFQEISSSNSKKLPDSNQCPIELSAFSSKKEESNLKRRDSIATVLSPTDLLHMKQKALASNLIKSTHFIPVLIADNSNIEKSKKLHQDVDMKLEESDTRHKSPSEDEFPLLFDSEISMSEKNKASVESVSISNSSDVPLTKGPENSITEATSYDKLSSENSFILSGYDIAEYMIDSEEDDMDNAASKYENFIESQDPLGFPTLPELQQKILNENFKVVHNYSETPKFTDKVSPREETDVSRKVSYSLTYNSPTKRNKKINEREMAPGLGAISYTSPSKLHQKITEREMAEMNTPGLGAFSYSKSKQHQKIVEREMAGRDTQPHEPCAASHTASSEYLRISREKEREREESPAPDDLTLKKGIMNKNENMCLIGPMEKLSLHEGDINESLEYPLDKELSNVDFKKIEQIKKKARHRINKCSKDEKLNNFSRRTQECSQSDIALQDTNEPSYSCIESKENLDQELESKFVTGNSSNKQQMKGNSSHKIESDVSDNHVQVMEGVIPKRLASEANQEDSYLYLNGIVTYFLLYIKDKQMRSIPVTDDDYKELMLIQALLTEVSKECKEAKDDQQSSMADCTEDVPFLQHKDSIIVDKMKHQLELARNKLSCHSARIMDSKGFLEDRSVDSIKSGYLGEIESNEMNTESFASAESQNFSQSLSEDTGSHADVNNTDISTARCKEYLKRWMSSSESGARTAQDLQAGNKADKDEASGDERFFFIYESLDDKEKPMKEKVKNWRKRCTLKEKLDNLYRMSRERSQSDLTLRKASFNESLCSCMSSKENLDKGFENGFVTGKSSDEQQMTGNNMLKVESDVSDRDGQVKVKPKRLDSAINQEDPLQYLNHVLMNFMIYIKDKQMKYLPVTDDDFKELMLFQALLTEASKECKEAKDDQQSSMADCTEDVPFLKHKDSIIVDKMKHQLELARNMLSCHSARIMDSKGFFGGGSVDSIKSGYLGEIESNESNEMNTESFASAESQNFSQSLSEDTGSHADVNNTDISTARCKEYLKRWMSSSESGARTAQDLQAGNKADKDEASGDERFFFIYESLDDKEKPMKEKVKNWRKRCTLKEKLDNLCRMTRERSQSDLTLRKASFNESLCSCMSSKENLDKGFENGFVTGKSSDEQQMTGNNMLKVESDVSDRDGQVKVKPKRLDSAMYQEDTLQYLNHVLINFMIYIKDKQMKYLPVTDDDFKELMLIQALLTEASKECKEAKDDQHSSMTDCSEDVPFLQHKDSIIVDKMKHQLKLARNMLSCNSISMESKGSLEGRSNDLIKIEYLGENECNEMNAESFAKVMTTPVESPKFLRSLSDKTHYLAGENQSGAANVDSKDFLDSWMSFGESGKGTGHSTESVTWICKCDRCMQRKPSERQILSSSTSLQEAELRHMFELSRWIWQQSIEATTDKRDTRKVAEEKHPEMIEPKCPQNLQEGEKMAKDETCGSENVSGIYESLDAGIPSIKSELNSVEYSPNLVKLLTCLEYPDDVGGIEFNIGPSYVRLDKEGWYSVAGETEVTDRSEQNSPLSEGSPDRGLRFSSSQNLDRRDGGGGKRKQVSRSMTPDSRYMLDKEVTESQNRKLQTEIATLQTENKLLKEKYNRAQGRISYLETQLAEAQEDLSNLQDNLNKEVADLSTRTKQEISKDRDGLESKIMMLTKENEAMKLETSSLEKKLESSHRATDMARHNTEKSQTLEAHKSEISSLKEELNRVKALLEQSERHLRDEEDRHSAAGKEIVKLTELKNALQQQSDSGGSAVCTDKQLKSLEKRLKVTEERLHLERADRANNLSAVEDKLLTDNAQLQASEKDLSRQLHREKEKNRNFEQRVKQVREENEKLRLAMPFDETTLLSNKGNYDIPYSSHSNQRAETMKHISDDMNYILSQIEKQDGLQSRDDDEIIRMLWNKREIAYRQLQEYDVQFQELNINENNFADGLKNLRDMYGQAESKLQGMEEQVEDARAQVSTLDSAYQQQLSVLVKERHEAFAGLKTAEDLLAALRAENEVLHGTMSVGHTSAGPGQPGDHSGKSSDAMQVELINLESKVSQLTRTNQLMEAELNTIRVQLNARDKAVKDVQNDLELAYNRLQGDDSEDRKQEKIDKLSTQLSSLQVELRMITDKYNNVSTDNVKLESEISSLRKQAGSQKTRQHKSEQSENKAVQQLKDDIEEKDSRLTSLTKQLDDLENKLQKSRQDVYIEQMHNSELESENENLQLSVAQRAQMFEALSGTEREQLAQYQILKDTLDNVSQELAQKHAQIISLDVNLSGARDNCAELEEEVRRLHKAHGGKEMEEQKAFTEDEQSSAHQLKIKELEKERAMLKQELEQAYSAIQASEEQYRTLQTESAQLEQELVKEKTVVLQLMAEKGETEQHLEELAEEHESLIQEKTQAEDDLIKLETKLQEILQKYETQARKQQSNFEQEYPDVSPEARKLIGELESLTLIAEGKEKEISMLTDKINRQNMEIDFLHHKVELVHNDSIANREDVARMISELTLKMKEAVSTREVNQFLVGERTKLQNEKSHLEKELDIERKNNDERKKDIQEVIRKIERTETSQKSTEKDSRNKDNQIISLESELRNAKHNIATMESEVTQLRSKVDHLNEDLKNLTGINSSLEKRLEMEQNSLSEEKNAASKWKDEFNTVSHDFQVLQHEHTVLNEKYGAELHTVEKLKRELDVIEEERATLKEDLNNTKVELDSNKGKLLITKDSVQKLSQDKDNIYQDYEGMCRSLTEKERQLTELRERTDEKMEHLKKEHMQERVRLEQDMTAAIQERDTAKKEMDSINEQLRQKEIQLNTFGKTLQELESVTREKRQLEAHVHKLESSTGDSKVLLDGQRKELMALNETLAKQQERTTRLEAENHTLQADLKAHKDSGNRKEQELNMTINELKSQHENERQYLNDNLSQTQTRLRSVEASLASAASDRDSLQAKARLLENTVEELQSKLSDENTGRRLAEQSVGTLRLQLEDRKNEKNVAEARCVEMKNQLKKAEEKLEREEEKCQSVSIKFQELNAISNTNRTNVKAKLEQIEMLQKEITNLKQMIETQKQNLNGKMKKATLEFKQQIESIEEEKDKQQMLSQQLSSDLDSSREHIASKNKENLKLQEEILVLEDSVRECKVKQKYAEDTLRVETDRQADLNARFEAQEGELKRLRNFLTKKIEQSGDSDKTMWHEMNRVIQELSQQMTSHLDSTRGGDKDRSPESLVSRSRKQLAEVQGELSTEKSLHQITKTSLQALEEDCQRLRKQLHHYRRRDPPSGEKRHKNRMEAINAIIARSQSQAQALLASGGFFDDTLVSPRVRSHQTSPKVGFHSPHHAESPDNSYSEDLSIASLPAMHYGLPSKK